MKGQAFTYRTISNVLKTEHRAYHANVIASLRDLYEVKGPRCEPIDRCLEVSNEASCDHQAMNIYLCETAHCLQIRQRPTSRIPKPPTRSRIAVNPKSLCRGYNG